MRNRGNFHIVIINTGLNRIDLKVIKNGKQYKRIVLNHVDMKVFI